MRLTPVAYALSFYTNSLPSLAVNFDAGDHALKFLPAAPQCQPAWEAISFAIHMASQAGQRHVKLVNRQRFTWRFVSPTAQHFFVNRLDDFGRLAFLGIRASRRLAKV